ncbi:NTP transferase domain-containing protein [Frankia sp. Cr1]|uniref:NTP transferase domain-containing protein n=1 Tax=Frankia sp. Cr1 TaxID=3073931 RepID=UPI002AD43B88|nr:NTP transferase domain-containing protein [Frankia sp. Cr1]
MTGGGPLTVVVPCAGHGTRLGVPFPKELLPVAAGRVLLDGVFELLAVHRDSVRVVLVVGADRHATVAYVTGRYPDWPVAFVPQAPNTHEMLGAVRSALPWCHGRVLVLLPDQWLTAPPADDPVTATMTVLADAPACFLAAPETNPARIAVDGALRIERPGDGMDGPWRVMALADKPGHGRTAGFNAVWFGVAFTMAAAAGAVEQMERAVAGDLTGRVWQDGPLAGCPVVLVPSFVDLGTWPALTAYWATAGQHR